MRVLLIIVGILFGAPILGSIVLQLYAAAVVAGVAYDLNEEIEEGDIPRVESPAGEGEVENAMRGGDMKPGYLALTRYGSLLRDRTVTFEARVRVSDLLQPGEKKPAPEFERVLATARATAFADGECVRLKKVLASECRVHSARATPIGDGLFEIDAVLNFVPREAFGSVDRTARLRYEEIRSAVAPRALAASTTTAATRKREELYAGAARLCEKLRRSEGNCSLFRLDIHTTGKRGREAVELTGEATISFLQELRS